MAVLDDKTLGMAQLTMEFLRRVVNELKGRRFEYIDNPDYRPSHGDLISAAAKQDEMLYCLPEMTRDFAAGIKPQCTHCYRLSTSQMLPTYTAHDPISGISIRCVRLFDVIHSETTYRFDAAFSMARSLTEIRDEIAERRKWALADENRDSKMFLRMLDELAEHIEKLSAAIGVKS